MSDTWLDKTASILVYNYIKVRRFLDKDNIYYVTVQHDGGALKTPNIFVFSEVDGAYRFVKAFMETAKRTYERIDVKQLKFVEKVVLKKRITLDEGRNDYRSNQTQSEVEYSEKNLNNSLVCLVRGLRKTRTMPGFYLLAFLPTADIDKATDTVQKHIAASIPVRTLYFYTPTGKIKSYFYN